MRLRHPELLEWIRDRHQHGACVYSACSGAVMLAATGLLDGHDATSHWAYRDLFRRDFPRVHFHPEPSLCFADDEGQLPYAALHRPLPHADSLVQDCQQWLQQGFNQAGPIATVVKRAGVPERTLKRRFKAATGMSLIDYLHNLRVEEARRLLETTKTAVDDISAAVGYEEPAFFRRLFKRTTGLTPGRYRKMFGHLPGVGPVY